MYIIQLAGIARVGKTTAARFLGRELFKQGYLVVELPFAKALKDEVALLGVTKESNPAEYRRLCQDLGSFKRREDPNYWINKTEEALSAYIAKEIEGRMNDLEFWEYCVIQDDLRYMNELAWGREYNAAQLYVFRGNRHISDMPAEWRKHESEDMANNIDSELRTWNAKTLGRYDDLFTDYIINDGTLAEYDIDITTHVDKWLGATGVDVFRLEEESDYEYDDDDDSEAD